MSSQKKNTSVDASSNTVEVVPQEQPAPVSKLDQKAEGQVNICRGEGVGKIYAHALAFPPCFGRKQSDYSVMKILEYWSTHSYNASVPYKSFGNQVLHDLMSGKMFNFALGDVNRELSMLVNSSGNVYIVSDSQLEIDFRKIMMPALSLANTVREDASTLGIAQYKTICDIVGCLYDPERTYMVAAIELYISVKLQHIAATTSTQNTRFILSALKMNNTVALVHQIFCAPTLIAKLTGVYRLLELHDLAFTSCDWCTLDTLAKFVYQVWAWIMEKTELAKEFLANGFKWKSTDSEATPEEIKDSEVVEGVKKDQSKEDSQALRDIRFPAQELVAPLPCNVCKQPSEVGCSLCGMHLCKGCMPKNHLCNCYNAEPFFHESLVCSCARNMDCWWEAVAANLNLSTPTVKRIVWRWLLRPDASDFYIALLNMSGTALVPGVNDYISFATRVAEFLQKPVINDGLEAAIVTCLAFNARVQFNRLEAGNYERTYAVAYGKPKAYININYFPEGAGHYAHCVEPMVDPPTHDVWGAEFVSFDHYEQLQHSHIQKMNEIYRYAESCRGSFKDMSDFEFLAEESLSISASSSRQSTPSPSLKDISKIVDNETHAALNSAQIATSVASSLNESEITTSSVSQVDSLKELIRNFQSYDVSGVTQNDNTDESTKKEKVDVDQLVETPPEGSFWELLKDCQWSAIGKRIKEWFKNISTEILLWFEENKIFAGLISLVCGIASFVGINIGTFAGGRASAFLKKFSDAQRTMYYTERSFGSLSSVFSQTVDVAKEVLGISPCPEVDDFKEDLVQTLNIALEMQKQATVSPGTFVNDGKKFLEFAEKYKSLAKIYEKISKFRDSKYLTVLTPVWTQLNTVYHSLQLAYNKVYVSIKSRPEVVCIYIYGESNIGKTHMAERIVDMINEYTGRSLSVYTVSKGNDYWNGYAQQDIIRIDDMNAVVGNEQDIDSVNVYNICSSAQFNPNQAALEDKNIMLNAKFLIICSNHPTVPSNSLVTYRYAWERRRNLFIKAEWPEHEKCARGIMNCEHIKARDARTEALKGKSDYAHLRLRLCNPVVSYKPDETERPVQTLRRGKVTDWAVISESQLDAQGVVTDIDTIVRGALWWENKYRVEYERKLLATPQGQLYKEQALSWEKKPFIMLAGDPGTGKSYVLQRISEKYQGNILQINTESDFKDFHKNNFKADNYDLVVINDLSAYALNTDTTALRDFVQYIRTTYDENKVPSYLLVCAANIGLLESFLNTVDPTNEMFQLFIRRFNRITCQFKRRPNPKLTKIGNCIGLKLPTHYIEKDIVDKSKTPEFVEYYCDGNLLSQESLVSAICFYKPKVVEVKQKFGLDIKDKIIPDTVITFPLSTDDFLNMINKTNISQILKVITSGKVKTYSKKGMTLSNLASKLQKIVKGCGDLKGSLILGLDDLLLQAWNKNLLKEFMGSNIVMHFSDRMYYIEANVEKEEDITCGQLTCQAEIIQKVVEEVEYLKEVVNMTTVFNEDRAFLPHWVILASEIFSASLGVAVLSVSSVLSVMDQNETFKAREEALAMRSVFEEAVEKVKRDTTTYIGETITGASPYNVNLLRPGPKARDADQYSHEDVDPIGYPDLANELETPKGKNNGQFNSGKGSRYGFKRRDHVSWEQEVKHQSGRDDFVLNRDYLKSLPVMEQVKFECARGKPIQKSLIEQVSHDPQTKTIVEKLLKNVCELHTISGERLCSGIFIRGRTVRTVSHLLNEAAITQLRVFTQDKKAYPVTLLRNDRTHHILDLKVDDIHCPQYPDITQHFPDNSATIHEGSKSILVTPKIDPLTGKLEILLRPMFVKCLTYKRWTDGDHNVAWHYRGHKIGYSATGSQTEYGDCGSLLIVCDPTITTGKCIGMHFAATQETALASEFRKDQYEDTLKYQCLAIRENEYMIPDSDPDIPSYVGRTKHRVFLPSKTKLSRNWYPVGPELVEPSVLDRRDPRGPPKDMLYDECEKWLQEPPQIPAGHLDIARGVAEELAHEVADMFEEEGVKLRKLTSKEALNKLRECDKSEPVNMHTSAGFPYNIMTKQKGKAAFLEVDDQGIRHFSKKPENQKYVQLIQTKIAQIEDDKKSAEEQLGLVVFQIFLKDEVVKKKKIYTEEKKTRTIGAVDLPFSIVYRKYFHCAQAYMLEYWQKLWHAVGINPLSLDWHYLYTKLAKNSVMGMDLDFKDWDFSHAPVLWDIISTFWIILYQRLDPNCTEKDTRIRKKLYKFLTFALLLIGTEFHVIRKGLISGYPGTSIDGSNINVFILVTAWIIIMVSVNPRIANYTGFKEDVAVYVYSDDWYISMSQYVSKFFNGITIAKIYREFGFNPQSADKETEIQAYKPLNQCTFLAREFHLWNGFWIGPLKELNLNKSTHFCNDRVSHYFWESPDRVCQSPDIVESVYRSLLPNAALRGKQYYETYRLIYNKVVAVTGGPKAPSWQDQMAEMFPIPKEVKFPIGFEIVHVPQIIEGWQHPLPHNYKAYHNRTSYHYGPNYRYNGGPESNKMTKQFKSVLELVNKIFKKDYNSVLVNKYPPGGKIPWHKDNEPCLDLTSGIVGITMCGDGKMHFKDTEREFQFYQNPGMAYVLTEENLYKYAHMRDCHTVETYTFTFRRVVPRESSSPPQEHN
ncbi:hypothetical protein 1 [Wuhan spider virus 4]|uniref:hypothetical protein 1 n=1 Tax=Wuhan spider virus 4 TaxID=1923753 RepID=UPI00090B0B27|nr:hypothetical protein 1 [Wuhan spider virus 4]APG77425.1 hypothetical protein 1 [Wuhan spider virus 4]